MKWLVLSFVILLVGCSSPEQDKELDATFKRRGDARNALFVQCMELAAKMPRQADDDVSDIVDECSSASYYQTRYIK